MSRTISDPRHKALREFLVAKRKQSGLRQVDVAAKLRRTQDYVSHVETGQKVVGAVELAELAEAIGFDLAEALRLMHRAAVANGKPRRKRR